MPERTQPSGLGYGGLTYGWADSASALIAADPDGHPGRQSPELRPLPFGNHLDGAVDDLDGRLFIDGAGRDADVGGPPLCVVPAFSVDVPVDGGKHHGFDAHPGLDGVVYATEAEVVRLDAAGVVLWRYPLGAPVRQTYTALVGCAFSRDGERVWIYLPDAMMQRGNDRIVVLDCDGRAVAEAAIDTVGQGATLWDHQDGHMLVDVGEGQDGTVVFRCRLDGDGLQVHRFPWDDRCLIAVSANGNELMTVDHGQSDVAFHSYPDGEALFVFRPDAFDESADEAYVEWAGGYLDNHTAVVVLGGEDESTEQTWHRHYLVDVASRNVLRLWEVEPDDEYAIDPLGDGTWLRHRNGNLERHTTT